MTDKLKEALETRIKLCLREDGTFRFLCTSDYHAPTGERWDPRTRACVKALIEANDPDFFFIAGDLTHHGDIGGDEVLHEFLADVLGDVEERGIPWAHVPGNHDGRFETYLKLDIFRSFPHCISERGLEEIDGYGTYMIPVWPHDGHTEDGPAFVIWAFDSHSGANNYGNDYGSTTPLVLPNMPVRFNASDSVHFNQAAWYWDLSVEMEQVYGRKIPGVMLMHAPLQEHYLVTMNKSDTDMDGEVFEFPAPGAMNTGLFAAAYERGDVRAIVAGHDHINSFSGHYMGILLAEDASVGYDVYGDDRIRGGRLFTYSASDPDQIPSRHVTLNECLAKIASEKEADKAEGGN